jgi:hypothetical protein
VIHAFQTGQPKPVSPNRSASGAHALISSRRRPRIIGRRRPAIIIDVRRRWATVVFQRWRRRRPARGLFDNAACQADGQHQYHGGTWKTHATVLGMEVFSSRLLVFSANLADNVFRRIRVAFQGSVPEALR